MKLVETIPGLISNHSNQVSVLPSGSRGAASSLMSSKPCMEDYPSLRFWKRASYTRWLDKKKPTVVHKKRTADEAFDSEIEVLSENEVLESRHYFLEDANGVHYDTEQQKAVSKIARAVWSGL